MQCVANDIMHKKTATRTIINYIAWLNCLLCKVCMYALCDDIHILMFTSFNGLHNAEEMETSFRKYKKASPSRTVPDRQEKEQERKWLQQQNTNIKSEYCYEIGKLLHFTNN